MTTRDFWKSAGMHLVDVDPMTGWLSVTPQLIRAYLTRPEIHPIEESCDNEHALHAALMDNPFREVDATRVSALADSDTAENYRFFLAFRDLLQESGTIEATYLALMRGQAGANAGVAVPPVFADQLVHLIARNMLKDVTDPIRLRAAEIFFRAQTVSIDEGRVMLADDEIVLRQAGQQVQSGLEHLLAATGTPVKSVALDVLDEDNSDIYWERSDRFNTVVDFRFEQPAPDAFARVIETWLAHLLKIDVRVEPRPSLQDSDWRWHIGLDRTATNLLNELYDGERLSDGQAQQIVGLFRMRFVDDNIVLPDVRGHPVYLGLAMTVDKKLKMKPQNLLTNLPLRPLS